MTEPQQLSKPTGLPSFGAPPLNEVACGVTFRPLESFRSAHIGDFWGRVKEKYPRTDDAPPMLVEGESDFPFSEKLGFPLPRVWFIDASDTRLIQFQTNKLYVNWRSRGDESEYPRYPFLVEEFRWAYQKLDDQLVSLGPEKIDLTSCDLTYTNHIVIPEGESPFSVASTVIKDFAWSKGTSRFLPHPSDVSWRARFALPDSRGSLVARTYVAKRNIDSATVLVFELGARGKPKTSAIDSVSEWFDLARTWIVKGFEDLTHEDVQVETWKREA